MKPSPSFALSALVQSAEFVETTTKTLVTWFTVSQMFSTVDAVYRRRTPFNISGMPLVISGRVCLLIGPLLNNSNVARLI